MTRDSQSNADNTPSWDTPDDYEGVLSPTGTKRSAPNTIISLNAHLGKPAVDHPEYTQPTLSPDTLSTLADALGDRGDRMAAARLEIERRHLVADDNYAPTFTAFTLTGIAVKLVGVKLQATLTNNEPLTSTIYEFSDLIDKSHNAPLDERYDGLPDQPVVALEGDYVDPFRTINGVQHVLFTTPDGHTIARDGDNITANNTVLTVDDLPDITWELSNDLEM